MERWWDNEAHETTYPLIAQAESNAYNGHDTWDCIINSSDYSGSDTFFMWQGCLYKLQKGTGW